MKLIPLKILRVLFPLISFLFLRCGSFPNIELNKDYGFASKKSITIYVIPSDNSVLDDTFEKILFLDLQARGYKVVNANQLLKIHSDRLIEKEYRKVVDSLQARKYFPYAEVFAVAHTKWDSVMIVTDYWENGYYCHFRGRYAKHLSSQVAFFDKKLIEPILSFTASDTAYLYSEDKDNKLIYTEYPWMVSAKQISRTIKDIPICKVINFTPAANQFEVSVWVDKSYREKFPNTWKDRLLLRFVYANDILRSQFDIELKIIEFKEWDSRFSYDLENTFSKLKTSRLLNPRSFIIGITLNNKLKTNWHSRAYLGLSQPLGTYAIITAQPTFPSIAKNWNSIEEAITLVHEIGHLFGAIHVPDEKSVMYPYMGTLSYEFDELNKKIIESTKDKFFNVNEKNRIQNYFEVLEKIRKSPDDNSLQIVKSAGDVLMNYIFKEYLDNSNQEKLNSLIFSLSPDSAFAYAIKGYYEYKINDLGRAKLNFNKALEFEPGFGEVKHYLSLIPATIEVNQMKGDKKIHNKNIKASKKSQKAAHKK